MNKRLIGSIVVLSLFVNGGWSLWRPKNKTNITVPQGQNKTLTMNLEGAKKILQEA
ncbi:hypothetical protein V9J15_04230 [Candidatus Liberibacter africanus]